MENQILEIQGLGLATQPSSATNENRRPFGRLFHFNSPIADSVVAVAPVVLGRGEALFTGLDLRSLGYRTVEHIPTERATHIVLAK